MVAPKSPDPSAAARRRERAAIVAALCALVLAAAGCDADAPPASERPIHGSQLAVYASAPLHGPDRAVGEAILRAVRLALADDGGRIGPYRIRLVTLDAARPFTGGSDPVKVSLNARRAARDPAAVAYIGEVRTGASAVSIPILNEAGMLEVSPLDTALGLTTRSAAITGSPERYYPNAKRVGRTFARLVPSDRLQADALLEYMADEGARRIALLTDEDASGLALADAVRAAARKHGIAIAFDEGVDVHVQQHPDLIAEIGARKLDAVLYSGGMRDVAARVWRELAAADPRLKLFAPNMLADASFAAIASVTGLTTYATQPLFAVRDYPPAARRFARAYAARWGHRPPSEALYGYAAMRAVLAAVRAAVRETAADSLSRAAIVRAFFAARERSGGVLGPYAIDAQGDTSLRVYGAYRIVDGRLRYERSLNG